MIPVGPSESASDYNGPLSTFAEWHSLAVGVGAGLTRDERLMALVAAWALHADTPPERAHLRDVPREAAYALGGLALGYAARELGED